MLKKKYEYEIDEIEKEILKEKNYTDDLVTEWINKLKDNKEIQAIL
jgi:archaellum component FlaC